MIHQRVSFVPRARPSRRLTGKIQRFTVNLQFFVSEHLTRTRIGPDKVCDKVSGKRRVKSDLTKAKCPNASAGFQPGVPPISNRQSVALPAPVAFGYRIAIVAAIP